MFRSWVSLLVGLCWLSTGQSREIDFSRGQWVDLSHAYSDETLYWPTAEGFRKTTVFEGITEGGWYYSAYDIATAEHGGTHLDAPIHFFPERDTADQVPLERLIGDAVVIDVTGAAALDPDYQATTEDLQRWEAEHGVIPPGTIVLLRTGFAAHWPDAEAYLGTAQRGEAAVAKLHFPGIHPGLARALVHRQVAAVGLDTASVDFGQSVEFMTHRILFEANIPGFENLADLSGLPPTGAFVVALPMKIEGGSGAPMRVVAFVAGD
ncbi:MAG: cyclase family protein [Xanthomonadales bacterium]|nr:cyclase family protein [Xanthomonadales bacterium]